MLGYMEANFNLFICSVPFRLFTTITEVDEYHLELMLVVRADIPEANHGSNVMLKLPVPRSAMSIRTVSVGHCIIDWGYIYIYICLINSILYSPSVIVISRPSSDSTY